MRSEGFLWLSGVRLVLDMAFPLGGGIQRVFRMPSRAYGVVVSRGRCGEQCDRAPAVGVRQRARRCESVQIWI